MRVPRLANTIRALEELARDDQLRTSVAEKGAEAVASKFSNAEQIGKLESIYLRVIEAAKGRVAAKRASGVGKPRVAGPTLVRTSRAKARASACKRFCSIVSVKSIGMTGAPHKERRLLPKQKLDSRHPPRKYELLFFFIMWLPRWAFFNLQDFRSTNLMKTYYLCHLFPFSLMRAGYVRGTLGAPCTPLR